MRIAIVCGHFMSEVGYQEVYLAKAFTKLGHQVKVFTSTSISPTGRKIVKQKYKSGLTKDEKYSFEILRLKTILKFRSTVLSLRVKHFVLGFKPDIVIILGIGKMFAWSLLSEEVNKIAKVVCVFGDALEYRDKISISKRFLAFLQDIGFMIFKKRLYHKSVQICHRLIMNVPETEMIFLSYLNNSEKQFFLDKRIHLNLGYDSDEFYFAFDEREYTRKHLNISNDEVVIITSTRVERRKNLEYIIDIISKMYVKGIKVKYIIIGFLGDSYENELKDYISKQPNPNIFHCYTFLSHQEIRKLYCASDIGIWLKAAISIQEAMGTGLSIILEDKPSVNHLVQEGINGWYFQKGQLSQVVEKVVLEISQKDVKNRIEDRQKIAAYNYQKLSYDVIANKILDSVY
jgi:glycosyltransferase involved in cell wall biosynthesis